MENMPWKTLGLPSNSDNLDKPAMVANLGPMIPKDHQKSKYFVILY